MIRRQAKDKLVFSAGHEEIMAEMQRGREHVLLVVIVFLHFGGDSHGDESYVEYPLQLLGTLPLPASSLGRLDHLSFDPSTELLYLCGFEDSAVFVFDVGSGRLVNAITQELANPQGALLLPYTERQRLSNHLVGEQNHRQNVIDFAPYAQLYVTNDETGEVNVFDQNGKDGMGKFILDTNIELLEDADNVRYNAGTGLVYVGYGDGAEGMVSPAIAAIDPSTNEQVERISLPAHPESFQLSPSGDTLFCNTPNTSSITVVSGLLGRSIRQHSPSSSSYNYNTWRVPGTAPGNDNKCFPMAHAQDLHVNGTLFVGCREPPVLAMLDAESGRLLASCPIGQHTDDVWWDAARRRIYVSAREGFVSVVEVTSFPAASSYAEYKLEVIANVTTAYGSQTSYFDVASRRLFVPVPRLESSDPAAYVLIYRAL
mgnify:CR=1 FL=1